MEKFPSDYFDITQLTKIIPPNGGEYVWKFQGEHTAPTATVMGGTHGNEHAGLHVIANLLSGAKQKKIQVVGGCLNLAVGNPLACLKKERFVEFDMNRCFGAHQPHKGPDAVRAQELKALLDETDVLLDVHCTIKESQPFLAVPSMPPNATDLLCALGIETIITGPGLLPPGGDHIYADSYVGAKNKLGVTIEAGWKDDPLLVPHIVACVKASLKSLGIIAETPPKFEFFEAYVNVCATEGFTFVKEFKNWDVLKAGEVFATDGSGKEFTAPYDSYMLFPKPQHLIVPGQEACILVKK